jgi:hypothetical protein
MDAQVARRIGRRARWVDLGRGSPIRRLPLVALVALIPLLLADAVQVGADSYPQLACTAGTFVSSNSSAQAQQLLPQALAYCAEYNQVMGLLDQAATSGCLSPGDHSQLDSLVAKTSAFESSYGTIFVTELDSWYESQADSITVCEAAGGSGSGPTPFSIAVAGFAALVVLGALGLAVRSNRRRPLRTAAAAVATGGWTSAPTTSSLQGPGIAQPPPPTAGLQGPGILQAGLPPFIGAVSVGAPIGGAGASVAPPEMPAVRDLNLIWGPDGRPTLTWQPPQLDPSRWALSGYYVYQYQFTGASTLPQPLAMGTISPGSTSVTVNWTVASQTHIFSTGGDVADWGVQPVFQTLGGQFAGSSVTGPVGWVPLVAGAG